LGAFTELPKGTIGFVLVCPPVCMEQLCSPRINFNEIWFLSIFRKFDEKIQVSLIKAHISCSVIYIYFFLNRAAYEIMWNNIVEPERRQMIIWCLRIACRIRKATHTLGMCNTNCLCTAITVARTHFNVTLYVQCLSCNQ